MVFRQKYSLISFVLIFNSVLLKSQNPFISNLYNNLIFNNPSLATFNDFSLLQLNYRNQWPIDGIYNTYGVSYFQSAESLNSNFGGILLYDRQLKGALTNISTGINYSFKLPVSQKNYILFGMMGSFNYQSLNYSRLVFDPNSNPSNNNQNNSYPILNSGVSFLLNENQAIGISVVNIFSNPVGQHQSVQFHANYLSHYNLERYNQSISYVEAFADIFFTQEHLNLLYGSNIDFSAFKTGFLINQQNLSINSISFLLGISYANYDFIYSYDLNLAGKVTLNPKIAAHEVTFLMKFQYKKRTKHHRAIKCPKI
jgi:type IX secretion system PorP/SprF family membrane protein